MIIKNCSKLLQFLIHCPIIINNNNYNMYIMYLGLAILQTDIKGKSL